VGTVQQLAASLRVGRCAAWKPLHGGKRCTGRALARCSWLGGATAWASQRRVLDDAPRARAFVTTSTPSPAHTPQPSRTLASHPHPASRFHCCSAPPLAHAPHLLAEPRRRAAAMSGWTTIWVLIAAVGAGSGAWISAPKGPNQVCVRAGAHGSYARADLPFCWAAQLAAHVRRPDPHVLLPHVGHRLPRAAAPHHQ
jgi:hypothetical protein